MSARALVIVLCTALCTASATAVTPAPAETWGKVIGVRYDLGGPIVTPLEVVEDSRCPIEVDCIWAGRVLLKVRIELGSGTRTEVITDGGSILVADGTLELTAVHPEKSVKRPIALEDYRFDLTFNGGL